MINAITNHLWQSTVFAIAAAVLVLGLRRNHAAVRFWVWFGASLKFLLPFTLLLSLGSRVETPAVRSAAKPFAITEPILQLAQPLPESFPPAASTGTRRDWVAAGAVGVWACGFAGLAWRRVRGWRRVREALRSSVPVSFPAQGNVRSSSTLLEPGVVGWFRPVLLVPEGIEAYLTPQQLEAVLAHEMCHVRRRDNLIAAVHMIVETLFWFHPLVWWIGARLVEERERACDEEVLRLGGDSQVYAEGILAVCRRYVESPLACVSGVSGSNLKKRIEAIMTNEAMLNLNFAKRVALAAALVAALAVPFVVGVMNAPAIRAQSPGSIPKWESVAIRPCGGGEPSATVPGNTKSKQKQKGGFGEDGKIALRCQPLAATYDAPSLIRDAYVVYASGQVRIQLPSPPLSGGPDWIYSDRFDIDAKTQDDVSGPMMRGPMMRVLLEDRFKLKVRRETREVEAYALTIANGGFKLRPFQEGSCTTLPENLAFPVPRLAQGQRYCSFLVSFRGPNLIVIANGSTVDAFTKLLSLALDRPIIDKTGLAGKFDFDVEFAIDEATPRFFPWQPPPTLAADRPVAPSILTVIEEKVGLKLEPSHGPREYLVVDNVERPAMN